MAGKSEVAPAKGEERTREVAIRRRGIEALHQMATEFFPIVVAEPILSEVNDLILAEPARVLGERFIVLGH